MSFFYKKMDASRGVHPVSTPRPGFSGLLAPLSHPWPLTLLIALPRIFFLNSSYWVRQALFYMGVSRSQFWREDLFAWCIKDNLKVEICGKWRKEGRKEERELSKVSQRNGRKLLIGKCACELLLPKQENGAYRHPCIYPFMVKGYLGGIHSQVPPVPCACR